MHRLASFRLKKLNKPWEIFQEEIILSQSHVVWNRNVSFRSVSKKLLEMLLFLNLDVPVQPYSPSCWPFWAGTGSGTSLVSSNWSISNCSSWSFCSPLNPLLIIQLPSVSSHTCPLREAAQGYQAHENEMAAFRFIALPRQQDFKAAQVCGLDGRCQLCGQRATRPPREEELPSLQPLSWCESPVAVTKRGSPHLAETSDISRRCGGKLCSGLSEVGV